MMPSSIDDVLGPPPTIEEILGPEPQQVSAAPPQDVSLWRYPRMAWQQAATGIGRAAGLPGDVEGLVTGGRNNLFGFPSSNDVIEYLGRHGIGTTPDVLPQSSGERAFAGGVQGLFGAAPFMAAAPEAAVLSGAAGAAGGGVEGLTGSPVAGAAAGGLLGLGEAAATLPGALKRTASSLGSSKTLQEAGQSIQKGAADYFGPVAASSAGEGAPLGAVAGTSPAAVPESWSKMKPESLANKLLLSGRSGGTDLTALRANLPDETNELAAALLHTSPQRWNSLSSEAQKALIPADSTRRLVDVLTKQKGSTMAHALEALTGEAGGAALGGILSHVIPETAGMNPLLGAYAGTLTGMAMPSVWRVGRRMLQTPSLTLPMFAGGTVGGNTLVPTIPTVNLSR